MKWAESYRVVAESSSSFTLRPHASSLSSRLELLCGRQLLPPSLSLCGSLCRSPPLICVGGDGVRGGASAAHRLCKALLLLVLPDVAALRSVLASFWEQNVFSLLRRSDIITAAVHRKFWAPRRRRDSLKPALPQIKCRRRLWDFQSNSLMSKRCFNFSSGCFTV